MSDYEWDGWLDERLVVFGVNGQKKGKRKRRMRKIPIVFGSCFLFMKSSSEINRE